MSYEKYKVYIKINAVLKGKRKAKIHLFLVDETISYHPEQVIKSERKAWQFVIDNCKKFKNNASLNFYKFDTIDEIERMEMIPSKSILIYNSQGSIYV